MEETKEVRSRTVSGTICKPLQIFVPCASHELVPAALCTAVGMAHDPEAAVTLVYVHPVPFPLPLDRPNVSTEHLIRALRGLCVAVSIPIRILIVLARDRVTAIRELLPARSLVVLATRKHWWRTAEESLASSLKRDGHHVVLLKLNAAGSICEGNGACAIQGKASQGSREVRPNHA